MEESDLAKLRILMLQKHMECLEIEKTILKVIKLMKKKKRRQWVKPYLARRPILGQYATL